MGIERLSNEEHGPDPPIKVSTEAGSMPSRPPRLRRIAKTFASLGLCLIVLFTLFERAFLPPHGPRSFTRHRPIPSADLSSSLSDIPSNATSPGSNYLLSSLAGLGLQWPNTVHPCGHIAVPALVEIGTPLYHARTDAGDVPSPEWLAFDPEMSFAIMVGRGSPNGTFLHTYTSARPLRVLYFDGMSAALGDDLGGMQSQETLLTRTGAPGGAVEPHWWDDFGRAKRLCEWAKRRGDQIEGFVRMNAGFELLWCDFESEALRHLGHLNITPPGTPMVPEGANPRPPRGNRPPPPPEAWGTRPRHLPPHPHPHAPPPRHGNRTDRPRGPPTGPRKGPNGSPEPPPRWFAPRSQLSSRNAFEWLRTAEARYRSPQPHLDIDAHFAASLYDPRWTSLVSARNESEGTHKGKHNSNSTSGNMQRHRVWEHISDKDASGWAEMVEKNVEKWYKQLGGLARPTWTWPPGRTHHHPGPGYAARDRIDWPRKARYVMEHWGHRLGALRNMLVSETNASGAEQPENHRPDANGSSKISYTRLAEDVNLLTYSMLSPWLQGPDVPYDQPNGLNPSDSDAQAEGSWKTQTLKRCIRAHTVGTRYAHRGDTQVAHERFLELGAAAAEGTHQAALEGVLERLCADVLDTFARSLEARSNWVALQNVELEPTPAVGGHAHVAGDQKHDHVVEVRAWREKIEELMRWLDWTVWDRCPRQCGWDEICTIPIWPLGGMPGGPGRRPPPYHPGGPGGPGGPLPPDHPDHPGAPDHPGPPPFPDAESGPERARPDSRSDRDADYHGRQPPRGRPDDDVTPRCMSFEAWQRDRRGPL